MSRKSDEPAEEGATVSLPVLLGALVLLVAGGFLSGGIVVSFFERGGVDAGSAAVIFLLGVGMVVVAFFLIRRLE